MPNRAPDLQRTRGLAADGVDIPRWHASQGSSMNVPGAQRRSFLIRLAAEAMKERGFEPEFSPSDLTRGNTWQPLI